MSSPSLVLPENELQHARSLAIACNAIYHLQSPWYTAEQYVPTGVYAVAGTSWCVHCWRRYLLLKAGLHMALEAQQTSKSEKHTWPELSRESGVLINAGWKAWLNFAREASDSQIKVAWAGISEDARRAVDDIDKRPIEEQVA